MSLYIFKTAVKCTSFRNLKCHLWQHLKPISSYNIHSEANSYFHDVRTCVPLCNYLVPYLYRVLFNAKKLFNYLVRRSG